VPRVSSTWAEDEAEIRAHWEAAADTGVEKCRQGETVKGWQRQGGDGVE
jgi:hypothetical protein